MHFISRTTALLALFTLLAASCQSANTSTPIATSPGPNAGATLPPEAIITSPPPGLPMPTSEPPPYAPSPSDSQLVRGNANITDTELLLMESYPVQVMLVLRGTLPTPCHQLRVDARPADEQGRVQVEVYTVVDPAMACIQMIKEFEANVPLGSFPSGHYSVWLNGKLIKEFDV